MKRLAVIEIPLFDLQTIDAFDIGEILQNLPEDTKIVSFGEQLHRAVLTIVVSNPKFKEIDLCKQIPVIKYSGNDYESFTVDYEHVLDEVICTFKNGAQIYFNMGEPIKPRTGFCQPKLESENLPSWVFQDAMIYGTGFIKISTSCDHQWKSYQGLIEKYDYCEKCQEKK